MKTRIYNSSYKSIITKSMLEYDMYELKMSQREMAKKYNVRRGIIQNLQYEYNLEILNLYKRRVPENLTEVQKQLIYGTSFADGHIFRKNENRNGALKICHSVKQIEYLNYKYEILKDFVRTKPTRQVSKVKDSVSIYESFRTLTHPFFTDLHILLYKKINNRYVKFISKEFLDKLDDFSLAIAYMDDGTKHNACRDFCFECFSYEQQKLFCEWLKEKFDIESSIIKYRNNFRTRIIKKSVEKFVKIVEPYILDSMKYKL